MSFRPLQQWVFACLLVALQACKAQLPDKTYRCDSDEECMPELPYCVRLSAPGDRVCSSSRRAARDGDASFPDAGERGSAISEEDAAVARTTDAAMLDGGAAGPQAGGAAGDNAGPSPGGDGADRGAGGSSGQSAEGSDASRAGAPQQPEQPPAGGFGVDPSPTSEPTPSETKQLHETAYIKADSAQAQRRFGSSLALRGDLLVVGAPYDDVAETMVRYPPQGPAAATGDGRDAGAAYVYHRVDGQWTFVASLTVPNGAEAHFARSVAIDEAGTRIVIGVAHYGSLTERVYLYTLGSQGRWVSRWSPGLTNPPGAAGFGAAVAIHGDVLVVGAPDESVPAAYVYTLGDDSSVHGPPLRLTLPNSEGSRFGHTVAIWGDTLVVGAPYYSQTRTNAGAAFVFRRDLETRQWSSTATSLLAPNPDGYDDMGFAVAVDDAYVAVGAPGTQPWLNGRWDLAREDEGAVHLFRADTGAYEATARPPGEDTSFGGMGRSVALDGVLLVAGAPGVRGMHAGAGKAYVFRRGALETPLAVLSSSRGDPRDRFGAAVGASGGAAAVGSSHEDGSATGIGGDAGDNSSEDNGAVYTFELD